jgi:sugar lactone lactonase YvrE
MVSPQVALASDTQAGAVYRFNLAIGSAGVVITDSTMTAIPGLAGGINGVRVHGKYLYYTNTVKGLLARIPIDSTSGSGTGAAQIISSDLFGADDFAIGGPQDEIFVMNFLKSQIVKVDLAGTLEAVPDSAGIISWPTSAQFGRTKADERTLYVTSAGNPLSLVVGSVFEGGKVLAIKLS